MAVYAAFITGFLFGMFFIIAVASAMNNDD